MPDPISRAKVAGVNPYVERAAELTGLPPLSEDLPVVSEHFAVLHAIAQALLNFPLPEETDAAGVFQP